jgi:outer membrane receptor protein involved in Fe transport
VTWSYPATNKLLFEAGATVYQIVHRYLLPDGLSMNDISVLEQSTGYRYNGPLSTFRHIPGQENGRASMSYVTGSHHFKSGGLFAEDQWTVKRLTLNLGLRFDYFNGFVPASHQPAGL